MRKIQLLLLLSVFSLTVYSFPVDTARINRTFATMVARGYTAETQREFFDAFPKTWHEYWLTYGNIPSFDNLNPRVRDHLYEGLAKLNQIPDSLYCDRLISLGIAGTVDADDVGHYLQKLIRKKLETNPQLMFERLSKKYYTSYFPFWYFVFNSLLCHSDNLKLYEMLHNQDFGVVDKYPLIFSYMSQAFAVSCGKARFMDQLFPSYYGVTRDIETLKSFYTRYITNMLENKDDLNYALKKKNFLPILIGEMEEMNERSGVDNVIRGQDVNEAMLKSLDVKPLDKSGWYMVSYSWNRKSKTSIPVKVEHIDGRTMIAYIMPDALGTKYGDEYIDRKVNPEQAASGKKMLESFYTQYITNMLENKDNQALRSECIAPDLLQDRISPAKEYKGFDLIINAKQADKSMLESLKVKPLDKSGWYMISYSRPGRKTETAVIVKLEPVGNKSMIRYIAPVDKV